MTSPGSSDRKPDAVATSATPLEPAEVDPAAQADAVVAIALAQPGVARLSSGHAAEVATYLPGRRVTGVRLTDDAVEVHIVARWVPSLPDLAQRVRESLTAVAGRRKVVVFIDDLEAGQLPDPREVE
jgi:hypothetical protein